MCDLGNYENLNMKRFALVALATLAGCATLFGGGTSQSITIASEPSGMPFTVRLPNSGLEVSAGTTPGTVQLPRRQEYVLDLSPNGFQPRSIAITRGVNGWLWWDLITPLWLGAAVDFGNGAAFKLEPAAIRVRLEPVRP